MGYAGTCGHVEVPFSSPHCRMKVEAWGACEGGPSRDGTYTASTALRYAVLMTQAFTQWQENVLGEKLLGPGSFRVTKDCL